MPMKREPPITEREVRIQVTTTQLCTADETEEECERTITVPKDMLWIFETFWECGRTAVAKNTDYSQGDKWYNNFEGGGLKGIVNRMQDKFCRLVNLLNSGQAAVKEETFEDTCMDLATYALLLMQAHKEGLSLDGELWE